MSRKSHALEMSNRMAFEKLAFYRTAIKKAQPTGPKNGSPYRAQTDAEGIQAKKVERK